MVGRLLLVATLVVGVLMPTAAGASDDAMVVAVSSWTPTTMDRAITGGTRTVTLVNNGAVTAIVDEFPLGPDPCDCWIAETDATHGFVAGGDWEVGSIEPGTVATLELRYASSPRIGRIGYGATALVPV